MEDGTTHGRSVLSAGTRAGLIDAARLLFHRDGFESVTVRQIASAMGMTTGALYAHFDSKTDVLFAVVAADVDSGLFRPGRRRSADARLRAEALLLTVASLAVREPRARVLLVAVLDAMARDSGRTEKVRVGVDRRQSLELAGAGQAGGSLRFVAGDVLMRAAGYRIT